MFNIVQKDSLLPNEVSFSSNDAQLPPRLLSHLTFYWIEITSYLGVNPVIPTDGNYRVFVRTNSFTSWIEIIPPIKAASTGGSSPNGVAYKASFYSGIIEELKVVPEGVVGADSFTAFISQADRGSQVLPINEDIYGRKRLSITNQTREEALITDAEYYAGFLQRTAIPPIDTYYNVVKTGTNYVSIEDLIITVNGTLITSGVLDLVVEAYFRESVLNTFDFTTTVPDIPIGRNTNTEYINKLPTTLLAEAVIVNSLTGQPDFTLYSTHLQVETQGNRLNRSLDTSVFFAGVRKMLLKPNTEVLLVTRATGNAVGTFSLDTLYFISEFATNAPN